MLRLLILLVCIGICVSQMPGGRRKANLNDVNVYEQLKSLSNFAINEITNKRRTELSNNFLQLKLIRITDAETQVVAGKNTFLKFRMRDAACKSGCSVEICSATIYERPWLNETTLTEYKCDIQRAREVQLLGGKRIISVDDPYVQNLINFAIEDLNKNLDQENYHALVSRISAQTQVVNGFNYFLKFLIAETDCNRISGLQNSQNCKFKSKDKTVSCDVTVHDQPWLETSTKKVTRSNCKFD